MTTEQRRKVREHVLQAGFHRDNDIEEPNHYDRGDGVYTEVWRSSVPFDRTRITIEWDRKTT